MAHRREDRRLELIAPEEVAAIQLSKVRVGGNECDAGLPGHFGHGGPGVSRRTEVEWAEPVNHDSVLQRRGMGEGHVKPVGTYGGQAVDSSGEEHARSLVWQGQGGGPDADLQ